MICATSADAPGAPARVLFATHYHELTELALVREGVKNRTMSVKEWKGEVVFLRKVVDGTADRSYGVQVAKLAGIPAVVTERAKEILRNLEKQQLDVGGRPRLAEHEGAPAPAETQLDLFRGQEVCRTEFTVTREAAVLKHIQSDLGIGNRLQLLDDALLENLHAVQLRNGLAPSGALASGDFTVRIL